MRAANYLPRRSCLARTELTQLPAAGANNYLGLSNHPRLVAAAHAALDEHGFGLSSVRFICGTQAQTPPTAPPGPEVPVTHASLQAVTVFDSSAGVMPRQDAHRRLETQLAEWHHQEAAILFPSCFDANAGLFEVRVGHQTWRSCALETLWAEDALMSS